MKWKIKERPISILIITFRILIMFWYVRRRCKVYIYENINLRGEEETSDEVENGNL